VLRLDNEAHGIRLRETLEAEAERPVSRGALYKTLERMELKGLVTWEVSDSTPERGGIPRRCFQVTPSGVDALRHSRRILLGMWDGLEGALG
jgi:DNA-binding PadR family transcriptional regulator